MVHNYRIVSGDSHLQVPADFWTERVSQKYRDLAPKRVKWPAGGEAIVSAEGSMYFGGTGSYAGHTPEDFDPMIGFDYATAIGSGSPEQRIREQDQDGVDAELLFPGTSATYGIRVKDPQAHLAMVRAYNDFLADYCAAFPDRLFGVAMLPSGDIDSKIAELERSKRSGIRAVGLKSFPSGKPYPTAEDDRFWAAVVDLEVPLTIHTTISLGTGGKVFSYAKQPADWNGEDDFVNRLHRHANPARCGGLTACQMLFAGVWDRFPRLKVYWAENNVGWIPFYLEQMDAEYEKNHYWAERHFGISRLARRPSEYIKEQAYWGFYDDPVGIKLRHEVGVDHIIWGSDFPHVVTYWPHSRAVLDRQMGNVPADERRKMEADNILKFLGISPS